MKEQHKIVKAFVYESWKDAVTDCVADAIGHYAVGPHDPEDWGPDAILEDHFGDLEQKIVANLKEVPGMYIIYTRWPISVWRSFLKALKDEEKGE